MRPYELEILKWGGHANNHHLFFYIGNKTLEFKGQKHWDNWKRKYFKTQERFEHFMKNGSKRRQYEDARDMDARFGS